MGKPSKGTSADKRLQDNKRKAQGRPAKPDPKPSQRAKPK